MKEAIAQQEEEQRRLILKYEEEKEQEQAMLEEEFLGNMHKEIQMQSKDSFKNVLEDLKQEPSAITLAKSGSMDEEDCVPMVIVEKASLILGVRSKFMLNFIVVKFMDLDLSYAG